RRELLPLLAEEDRGQMMMGERGLKKVGAVQDLTSHGILDRGRVIGLWEFDPAEGRIAWSTFIPKNAELAAAVQRTEAFIRDQLGDARSFSLDSPESRKPRLEALRD